MTPEEQKAAEDLRRLDWEMRVLARLQTVLDKAFGSVELTVLQPGETWDDIENRRRLKALKEIFPARPRSWRSGRASAGRRSTY